MTVDELRLDRRQVLTWVSVGAASLAGLPAAAAADARRIEVFKNPSCGCCSAWADHLRANGFEVTVNETSELSAIKSRAGVPGDLASCHTGNIEGYVIEGHVPAHAINRLLAEKPSAIGLAVPGMPAGSPGMNGEPEAFDVILFDKSSRKTFGTYQADKPV